MRLVFVLVDRFHRTLLAALPLRVFGEGSRSYVPQYGRGERVMAPIAHGCSRQDADTPVRDSTTGTKRCRVLLDLDKMWGKRF